MIYRGKIKKTYGFGMPCRGLKIAPKNSKVLQRFAVMHLMTTLATMHGYGDYYKDFTLYANYLHECGGSNVGACNSYTSCRVGLDLAPMRSSAWASYDDRCCTRKQQVVFMTPHTVQWSETKSER